MQLKHVLLFVGALAAAPAATAQTASAKGVASVPIASTTGEADRALALKLAKINALERWFAESNQAQLKNWESVRDKVIASLDDYFLSTQVLSEETDAALKEYRVVVRGELNQLRLENTLQSTSAVGAAAPAERSMLTFVFVAREQASLEAFDRRVSRRTDTGAFGSTAAESASAGTESEAISRRSVQTADSSSTSSTTSAETSNVTTTGGSTTTKADVVTWRVANSAEINSIITGIFTNAGFDVVEAEYLEGETGGALSTKAFHEDYSKGDDLAPETLRSAVKGIQSVGGRYFALGTLDAGMKDTDPATGLVRVYVTVMGKVLDLAGRFPRTVSSVGPAQYAGLGPTEAVARTNALKAAAQEAGKKLLAELNAKGVR